MISLLASLAFAGAFGVESGTPLSALDHPVETGTADVYMVSTVPMPNSAFDGYLVIATPKLGVCKVMGMGKALTGDLAGTQVRGVATTFAGQLTAKYGKSESYDFLHVGSIWTSPGDFAMGLYLGQRTLAYVWGADAQLPQDISGILLRAVAASSTATSITLAYELPCFAAYTEAKKHVDTAGL